MTQEKTVVQLLKEEKEKLLAEVNQNVKRKKKYLKSEPETGFDNFSNK